jgi:hypothetical protein
VTGYTAIDFPLSLFLYLEDFPIWKDQRVSWMHIWYGLSTLCSFAILVVCR